jgi:hypothetical protein
MVLDNTDIFLSLRLAEPKAKGKSHYFFGTRDKASTRARGLLEEEGREQKKKAEAWLLELG